MSAFLVGKGHIDVLTNAWVQYVVGEPQIAERMQRIGAKLWSENNRSVNYRYDERKRTPSYKPEIVFDVCYGAGLDPVAVLHALDCWDYQARERPDFEKSEAYRIAADIREGIRKAWPGLFAQVPCTYYRGKTVDAYTRMVDRYPWEFRSVNQALSNAS